MAKIVYANTIDYNMPLQQRPHHIMNELAERGHEIYWVNQSKNNTQFKKKIKENLTVFNDWEKFVKIYKNKIDIYFSSWSHRWVDIEKVNPKFTIYDSLDLFPSNESHEKKMVDSADAILTTAQKLYDYHKKHTDKEIHMCENGCFDKYRFENYEIPKELLQLINNNLPILLFSGAFAINNTGWVDFDLIKAITKKYYIVVVGMPWGVNQEFINRNKSVFEKIIYLGSKEYNILQSYYANCTINLLPFKRCQISDYSFPLKTIEGCNHGKICVSTDIPVSVELNKKYPKAVLTSGSIRGYMQNIDIAIKNIKDIETIKQCHRLADEHTWKKKVDTIEHVINNIMNK
jgi:hypothetical protein